MVQKVRVRAVPLFDGLQLGAVEQAGEDRGFFRSAGLKVSPSGRCPSPTWTGCTGRTC